MTIFECADPEQRRDGLASAADAARRGDLVVLPTDTVYGIGAEAFTSAAVGDLLAAKGRGRDMPVPVLIGSWATLDGIAAEVTQPARDLIEAFWPGALSLVIRQAPSLAWDLGDAHGTVMVRMPMHPVALELLRAVGPMAVSSANRSGQLPATTVGEARAQLHDDVAVYLDGGTSPVGVASTIVDLSGQRPRVLREGSVTAAEIGRVIDLDSAD